MNDKSRNLLFFYAVVAAIIVLDQAAKSAALARFAPGESLAIIPSVFHLTLVHNRGIAFGLFGGFERILFFAISASIVILTIVGHRLWRQPMARSAAAGEINAGCKPAGGLERAALALILGGAVGNWIDRVRAGAVVDFLDFRIWPIFNLADAAITIGVGLYLLYFFKTSKTA